MKHILIAFLLACPVLAQTTVPTRQVTVNIKNGDVMKQIKIILAAEVANRLDANTSTRDDIARIEEAVELELGHLGEQKPNPCDKPHSRLINDGRPVANCEASQK